jgi:isopenicillin-N N-acyltransferase-like protein
MTKTGYPFIQLEGSPFERGRIYGKECSNLIRKGISNYSFMFESFSGMSWVEAKERAKSYIPFITEYSPQLIEEMKGIAEGANLHFDDIVTLNSRSEIVPDNTLDGCTAFGVSSSVSKDGVAYVCQNWDWIRRQGDTLVILQIKQEEPLPQLLLIAEAGIISGKGLNSAGIGVCFNALSTGKGKPGVPIHILLREIMSSPTLGDAVEAVARAERASSGNFLVGTAEGEIINIESAPSDFGVLYAEKGYLAHTNHFLSPNIICKEKDHGKVILPDTFHRLGRINVLLNENVDSVDQKLCQRFLSDHKNAPDAICRHEDPRDPEGKQLASVYSIIMNLMERTLWISDSNPCTSEFCSYSFKK